MRLPATALTELLSSMIAPMAITHALVNGFSTLHEARARMGGYRIGSRPVEMLVPAQGYLATLVLRDVASAGSSSSLVGGGPYLLNRRAQIAELAIRYAIPTISNYRDYAEAGGLVSCGSRSGPLPSARA